ncbi:glycosyltransferase [Sporolactobacillus shoreae]|uniref:Glycosyltransferase n=2 Tax=Sporolactobacillus shoreae TaxID=1465501 RepID=A0A4Z0GN61_9BACL|nr:glycosyltransferase [Sporolactobacillus shoreae]
MIGLLLIFFLGALWRENIFKKPLILLCCMISAIYLVWRIFFTLPGDGLANIIAGIILLATEFIGFLQMLIFYTLVWKPADQKTVPLERLEKIPTVDILIATYNEPVSVLKRTIAGCLNLDYPPGLCTIYLCDDGGREEVQRMAEQFHVRYLARTDHTSAKAGNLNHALQHSEGDFIVTLDADMVPLAPFLRQTLGYFSEPEVAFVQTPQAFYNDDPYQYNTFSTHHVPNEQDFFMRTLQAGKARFNGVMFVGSNAVFRRTALDAIGGFATGVITEDMATGMILQSKKYKTKFVGEVLAMGLAPESWSDMLKQRDRWCRGNIQCAKKWNPLTMSGLTLMQRLLYMDGLIYWFFGLFKLVYVAAPLAFLLLGIYSLKTDIFSIIIFWLPFFLGTVLAFRIVSKRQRSMIWSHIYDTSMAPRLALSVLMELFFNKQVHFKVTPKGERSDRRDFQWLTILPHLILLVLTLTALAKVAVDYFYFHNVAINSVSFNLFWALYNMTGLIVSVTVAVNRPRFRRAERFAVRQRARLHMMAPDGSAYDVQAQIVDMSETGARVSIDDRKIHNDLNLVARALTIEGVGELACKMIWISPDSVTNGAFLGLHFDALSESQYIRVIQLLFNMNNPRRPFVEQRSGFIRTLYRFSRNSFVPLKDRRRQYVREVIQAEGYLLKISSERIHQAAFEAAAALAQSTSYQEQIVRPMEKPVTIMDISSTGCQIRSRFPLVLHEKYALSSESERMNLVRAEVVWTKRKLGKSYSGLRFL